MNERICYSMLLFAHKLGVGSGGGDVWCMGRGVAAKGAHARYLDGFIYGCVKDAR